MPCYQPIDALQSPRFCGVRTFARLPFVTTTEEVDVTVVGIPFDTGVKISNAREETRCPGTKN